MDIDVAKRTYGPLGGAAVLVQRGDTSNQFALAEGPETALSVAQGNSKLWVWATLGISNFANISIPTGSQSILLCADNDGLEAKSNLALEKAVQQLSERGLNVWRSKPIDCKDFNDVLKKQGVEEVNQLLNAKVLVKEATTLEQLIKHKNTLASNEAKVMAEFYTNLKEFKHYNDPNA